MRFHGYSGHSQEPVYKVGPSGIFPCFWSCFTFFLLGALTIMILATLGIITI